MESYSPDTVTPVFAGCFLLAYIVVILAIVALTVIVHCKIFSKAGFHWALGLLMLIPVANFVMLLVLAFAEWPIHRELEAYKRAHQTPPPPQTPPSV